MISLLTQMLIDANDLVYYMRIQNYHEGSMLLRNVLGKIQQNDDICNHLKDILSALLEALEQDDMVLLADLVEEGLIPEMRDLLSTSAALNEIEEVDEYQVEFTSIGLLTVKHLPSGIYLHSNNNPMEEARMLVNRCFDASKREYVVWGCGLGYHVLRLYQYTRGAIPIRVFEESREMLHLAYDRGVLAQIPTNRLICENDPDGHKFATYINNHTTGLLLHLPSIKKIHNLELRNVMEDFYASWNGTIQFGEELKINYGYNILSCNHFVDELESMFAGNEIIIVGGGPSLNENIDFLKQHKGKSVIAAVTTVWRKLLDAGVQPDVVFVMDSQKRTYGHIEGVKDCTTPLVLDSTAYWEFGANYSGPKYIACQNGFPDAEKLAQKKGLRIYETGGSVVTLALDVALRLGAASVLFVGVDLAYPEGKSHASGTMDEKKLSLDILHPVKAQDGSITYSDKLFDMYRRWIEREISKYPQVKFYNLSYKGSYIEGAKTWMNK